MRRSAWSVRADFLIRFGDSGLVLDIPAECTEEWVEELPPKLGFIVGGRGELVSALVELVDEPLQRFGWDHRNGGSGVDGCSTVAQSLSSQSTSFLAEVQSGELEGEKVMKV